MLTTSEPPSASSLAAPATGRAQPAPPAPGPVALPLGRAVILSAVSALLLILAFPKPAIRALVFVALVPHLIACRGQGWKRGALLGWIHGLIFHGQLLYWANFFGPPAWIFLMLYKSIGPAIFGASLGRFTSPSATRSAWFAAVGYVGLEYYQMLGPFGITWGMLSHALARWPIWIQCCAVFGPWTLSLVIALVNASLAESLLRRRVALSAVASAGVGCLLTLAYGVACLAGPSPPNQTVTFGAIQVNMGRDVKWDPKASAQTMLYLEELTRQAAAAGAHVIVWPETTIPYRDFLKSPNLTFRVGMLARQTSSWLIAGSIELLGDGDPQDRRERYNLGHTYNTASLLSPEGAFVDRYDKQRLVPGGEYLPLEKYLPQWPVFDRIMNYLPGQGKGVFRCGELPVGLVICYESMVPTLTRQRVIDGAEVLLVSTNDSWFGDSWAIYHHFEMAIMRAVECRRPVVQAGNTGVTALIDRLGRVLKEAPVNERTIVVGPVVPSYERTPYVRMGDVLAWACLLAWALAWATGLRRVE